MIEIKNIDGKVLFSSAAENLRVAAEEAVAKSTYLESADLRGANLRGANLRGADLRGANLESANLVSANLEGANLVGTYLVSADLESANLASADLSAIRADLREILAAAPADVPGLLAALREGRVDGSTYEGECCCLVGTLARVRGVDYASIPGIEPQSSRPAERWFLGITKGDTPATSQFSAITEGWIVEWMAERAEVSP